MSIVMNIAGFDPLFADFEFKGVITIVVIVIAFVSWISNLISGKNKAQGGQARRQPRNPELASEIDAFLEEVGGGRQDEQAAIELVSDEELHDRRGAAQRRRARNEQARRQAAQEQDHARQPGSGIAGRVGPGSGDLGSNITSHVAEYMEEDHVDGHVAEHLTHSVNEGVGEHLGQFSGGSAAREDAIEARDRTPDEHPIAALLRSPQGVRQAVILTEIFSRPKRNEPHA
jgi:hypothetical protein